MSLIRVLAKAKQKQTETQNKSIEINEKEDESINPQQSVTELPTQIESGKTFYLDFLTLSPESSACCKNLQRIFESTIEFVNISDLGAYSKGGAVLCLILHYLLNQRQCKCSV